MIHCNKAGYQQQPTCKITNIMRKRPPSWLTQHLSDSTRWNLVQERINSQILHRTATENFKKTSPLRISRRHGTPAQRLTSVISSGFSSLRLHQKSKRGANSRIWERGYQSAIGGSETYLYARTYNFWKDILKWKSHYKIDEKSHKQNQQ